MKIKKYKYLGNGKYKINIEDSEYIIYEDTILKHSILTKEEISQEDLNSYLKDNDYYEAYYKAVNYIKVKLRTEKEIFEYLKKNNFSTYIIDNVIEKLLNDGYLNQEIYTECYIKDQINLKNTGPLKIENELLKLGISKHIIEKYMILYTDDLQEEKIDKIINKEIKLNKNKSKSALKNKILINLSNKGFEKEKIYNLLEKINIDDTAIYENEYQKIYDKLSKKYSGKELEYKIKEKLYQKGFRPN